MDYKSWLTDTRALGIKSAEITKELAGEAVDKFKEIAPGWGVPANIIDGYVPFHRIQIDKHNNSVIIMVNPESTKDKSIAFFKFDGEWSLPPQFEDLIK